MFFVCVKISKKPPHCYAMAWFKHHTKLLRVTLEGVGLSPRLSVSA